MDGILLIDKPMGMTSHDCVNRVRRLFSTKQVGHAGTLDPSATGVLVIALNRATKILQFLENDSKAYEATISIGKSTSTEDAEGEVLEKDLTPKEFSREDVLQILKRFLGKQEQMPPMISAVKVNGKKLYEYARKNQEVKRPVRLIEVYSIELLDEVEIFRGEEVTFSFRVHVSKGTYIRTLGVDIGKALGYPAHLKALRRVQSGVFSIERCHTFEQVEKGVFSLISLNEALKGLPQVKVSEEIKTRILNGQKLPREEGIEEVVFVDQMDEVIAIYGVDPNHSHLIKPIRVLANNSGK